MYTIKTNEKGSREMQISSAHLNTIRKWALFSDLIDSSGIVTEEALNKLRLNVRSLIESAEEPAPLIALCQDVLYHPNMKAYGLHQLINLYLHECPAVAADE